jgi:hypothetical protein
MAKSDTKSDQIRAMRERQFASVSAPDPRANPVGSQKVSAPPSERTHPQQDECANCKAKDAEIAALKAALAECDTSLSKRRAAAAKAQRNWRLNQKAKKERDK